MELIQALNERHSVRKYLDKPIEEDKARSLQELIAKCNQEADLHIQLILDEPQAFSGMMAHYGGFSGVKNYIALVGKKSADLDEKCGYYGEMIALEAQRLGLNTCFVALTYRRVPAAFTIEKGEKLTVVIALGYGENQGVEHRSKPLSLISNVKDYSPAWFIDGVEAAAKAPTAMNQQKFYFELKDEKVRARALNGFYAKVDLGIAKYNFLVGSKKDPSVFE